MIKIIYIYEYLKKIKSILLFLCDIVETKRFYFMGLAMLFVIFYHSQSVLYNIENKFLHFIVGRGFVGVDVFFFFSALGCSYSYEKNSLRKFYTNRVKRILPLFLLFAIYRICMYAVFGGEITLFKLFSAFTTLSFYIGGIVVDWYLSALIVFYLLFPLLFFIIDKFKFFGILIPCVIVFLILDFYNIQWAHDAFISRVPVFLLGIYYYRYKFTRHFLFLLLLYLICAFFVSPDLSLFLKYAFLSPIVIIAIASFYVIISKIKLIYSFIILCGKNSLEIYLAHIISFSLIKCIDVVVLKCIFFPLFMTLIAFLFYSYNKKALTILNFLK